MREPDDIGSQDDQERTAGDRFDAFERSSDIILDWVDYQWDLLYEANPEWVENFIEEQREEWWEMSPEEQEGAYITLAQTQFMLIAHLVFSPGYDASDYAVPDDA